MRCAESREERGDAFKANWGVMQPHRSQHELLSFMSNSLRDVIKGFKCELNERIPPNKHRSSDKIIKKKPVRNKKLVKIKPVSDNAAPASDLKDLPLSISENLTIVFIGFNPGVESSRKQHHYAHPTNLFWKLFNALDVLSAALDFANNDFTPNRELLDELFDHGLSNACPEHDYKLVDLGIGFTDLVLRCTKQALELSQQEKAENVPRLLDELSTSNAPFVIFIGKGIWETVCKFLVPKYKLTAGNFTWGKQEDKVPLLRLYAFCKHGPKVYVFPNTSGLVTLMKYTEKLQLWKDLVFDIRQSSSKS